jgi:mycothiol synthase
MRRNEGELSALAEDCQELKIRAPRRDERGAVTRLVQACMVWEWGEAHFTEEELAREWAFLDVERDVWVAEDAAGVLVGYATVRRKGDEVCEGDVLVLPVASLAVEDRMIERIEGRAAELSRLAGDGRLWVQLYVNRSQREKQERLVGRGYRAVREYLNMEIALKEAPERPSWPEGVLVRALDVERDLEPLYAVHREVFADHWGHTTGEFETFAARVRNTMERKICRVAVAKGEIVGYVLNRYWGEMGVVNTLGVRRSWRKRGLGLALLQHSFGLFYESGTVKVGLGVDGESLTGALRLYERAGMRPVQQYVRMEKAIEL